MFKKSNFECRRSWLQRAAAGAERPARAARRHCVARGGGDERPARVRATAHPGGGIGPHRAARGAPSVSRARAGH